MIGKQWSFVKKVVGKVENRCRVPSFGNGTGEPAEMAAFICSNELYFWVFGDMVNRHGAIADNRIILGKDKQGVSAQPFNIFPWHMALIKDIVCTAIADNLGCHPAVELMQSVGAVHLVHVD